MRILVAGTNRACHLRLAEHGHELVLFITRSKVVAGDLSGPYRHVVVLADDARTDLWVRHAAAGHAEAPFDAVAAYNESTYPQVAAISAALDVPCMVDIDLFARVRDKHTMRRLLSGREIPGCRFGYAVGEAAAREAVRTIGVPCVVKPVDGEASLGVARVDSYAEVDSALHWVGAERLARGVLVEEFLTGKEFSVEAISVGDKHHVVAITEKFVDERTFVERGHRVPAPIPQGQREVIEAYVVQVLDALGFHDCPSHTEIILTADGPRIVETHSRIGGDRIMDLIHHATGVDLYDLVARQSIGQEILPLLPPTITAQRYAAVWYADPGGSPDQELLEVRGLDAARALPGVTTVEPLKQPGGRAAEVRHSFDRSALAIATADDADEALRRARTAIGSLEFIYRWTGDR